MRCGFVLALLGLTLASSAGADEPAPRKAADAFKQALRDAKTVQEKALAIRALSAAEARDPDLVPPLARLLTPTASDVHVLLPVLAVEELSRFRNDRAAAHALAQALGLYRKVPYLHRRILAAIGRVGHESALPALEEHLKGSDADLALLTLAAIAQMMPATAVEALLREGERIEQRKAKASDTQKAVLDRLAPEIPKVLREISGEGYLSLAEFQIWWRKRGAAFKERAAAREAAVVKPASRPGLPPILIVELPFRENAGPTTANGGSSSIVHPFAAVTGSMPAWISSGPPNGWPALDWSSGPGSYAVDLPGPIEHLRNLKSFTLAGWLNCRSATEGAGGNRILTWLQSARDGVELAFRSDGSLQLGVNQPAGSSAARSGAGQVPELKDATPAGFEGNWRFFAVTYDSTIASGHVKFYFGTSSGDARLESAGDCPRGLAGLRAAPGLTVGHLPPSLRGAAPDRNFRGLIDEIRIFGSPFDGSGALDPAEVVRVQNRRPPTP